MRSNQKLKFNMTYKIKIKAITINNNVNMTDLKENVSYLKKKMTYKMKHTFSNFRLNILMTKMPRHMKN